MTCDSESSSGQQRGTPVKRKLSEQHGSQIQSSNQNIPSNQTKSQRSEAKRARKMEIETEFRILKSLIPNIANKQQINEVSYFLEINLQNSVIFWLDSQKFLSEEWQKYSKHAS